MLTTQAPATSAPVTRRTVAPVGAAVEGARDAERERIKSALMRKHEDSKDRHNLYACLAVEWFGPNARAKPPKVGLSE